MNSKASSNDPKYEIFYHINLSVVWDVTEWVEKEDKKKHDFDEKNLNFS